MQGCQSLVKKITQHLRNQHQWLTEPQVAHLAKEARPVDTCSPTSHLPRPKGQTSIMCYARKVVTPPPDEEYSRLVALKQGTRPFPSFKESPSNDLQAFRNWLKTAEGGMRSEKEASEITSEVSKILR